MALRFNINLIKRMLFRKSKIKVLLVVLTSCICYYLGVFAHMLEITPDADTFKNKLKMACVENVTLGKEFRCPIAHPAVKFLAKVECPDSVRLAIVVKSTVGNFRRRTIIRNTWGYEKRFSDVAVKRVFSVGTTWDENVNRKLLEERRFHGDIVQSDFHDSYYNTTLKTIASLKWAVDYCPAKFYLFVDDDMYVSIKNLLRFFRNPTQYPEYLSKANEAPAFLNTMFEINETAKLYAGYVHPESPPHRHQCSKWYVSIKEYPYSLWPKYVPAAAFVLSAPALLRLQAASNFAQYVRFDDIFLAFAAQLANLEPFHSEEFHMNKLPYDKESYRFVIASHGYGDASELATVWYEQKNLGNA